MRNIYTEWLPQDSATTVAAMESFAALLERWNRAYNLVSRRDLHRLRTRHICDSLAALPHLHGTHIADLGSGAGLPGLPLAIAAPDRHFTLIERSVRRVRFLRQALIELDIANVEIEPVSAEEVAGRGLRFHTVTSRAVAAADRVCALARQLLAPGGVLLLFGAVPKAPDDVTAAVVREYRIPDIDDPQVLTAVRFAGGAGVSGE